MNFYFQNDLNNSFENLNTSNKSSALSINPKGNRNQPNEDHSLKNKLLLGNWILAIGTIISAIGRTPSHIFDEKALEDFVVIGNILEAGGAAIISETEELFLHEVGGQISSIGNLAVVLGVLSNNEHLSELLEKQGLLFQLVGIGITLDLNENLTFLETITNLGLIIQGIGIVIDALSNLELNEGDETVAVGTWIKAGGAVITALATE